MFCSNYVPKTYCLWDIRLVTLTVTLKPGLGVTQSHWNRHGSIRHKIYDFLLTFYSNHEPISYRYWDKRRFQSKIAKFSYPRVFFAHAEGVPRGIGYGRRCQKTRMMGLPGRQRSLTISSAVWIECMNVSDRQTDGRTDGHRARQRPRLRMASRGRNFVIQ